MKNYIELGNKILKEGHTEHTRVGDTLALHNQMLLFNLKEGFPLMTTKHVGQKSVVHETLWYLLGTTSIKYLEDNKVFVWSKFANDYKDIGKTYSYQFRNFNGIDQVTEVIDLLNKDIEKDITNRRAIINLYNVSQLNEMSIPPCIAMLQFNIYIEDGIRYLNTTIIQRSADFCLGVPYDIAEMALIAHIIAAYTDSIPSDLAFFYSNIHIYKTHIDTLKEQLLNEPSELPQLVIDIEEIKKRKPEELTANLFTFMNIPKNRNKYYFELF